MEQSDTSQIHVLKATEGLSTDIDVHTTRITEVVSNQNVKIPVVTEELQALPNLCKLSLESTDNISSEAKTDDHIDVDIDNVLVKETDNTSDRIKHKTDKPNTKSQDENIEVCEHVKDQSTDSNYELELTLSNEEDQSLNVIAESNTVEAEKDATDITESDIDVVEDTSQSDTVDNHSPTVDNSVNECNTGDQVHNAHESVEETIKELHGNDDKQDSSIVTNTELNKSHEIDRKTEVLVEVLEATTPDTTEATTDNFTVAVDEKNADKECNQETVACKTLQEKKVVESGNKINQFDNLIECSQENDGTIIKIVSTEVIHSPAAKQSVQQNNENCVESNKCSMEPVKTDAEIAIKKSINDKNIKPKIIDSKSLISPTNKEGNTEISTSVIIDEKIIITENVASEPMNQPQTKSADENIIKEAIVEQDSTFIIHEASIADSSMKKRSVIQDIFDDWGVENADEDAQSTSKVHDSVEIELKSLLDETRTEQTDTNKLAVIREKISSSSKEYSIDDTRNAIDRSVTEQLTDQMGSQLKSRVHNPDTASKNGKDSSSVSTVGKSPHAFNATKYTAVPKNRSRHLTSQTGLQAEMTEVLKERLREKEKIVDPPRGADIFFVKKLTQRLSSKLAGGSINPASSPVSQQSASSFPSSASTQLTTDNYDKKTITENAAADTSKDSNSDNKELLAILEGDVDPDWSILKPPTLTEEVKTPSNVELEHGSPPKLDPLIERELALKQLLELPVTQSKKSPPRKKKTFKPAPNKVAKDLNEKSQAITPEQKKMSNVANESVQSHAERVDIDVSSSSEQQSNKKEQNVEQMNQGTRVEESRSGRKRKLTEKAREHEQNTIKRQKVYRGKGPINKKQEQEKISTSDIAGRVVANDVPEDKVINNVKTVAKESSEKTVAKENSEKIVAKEVVNKQLEDKLDSTLDKADTPSLKRSKQNLNKKGSQSVTKKKVVKKLLRQKISPNKKSVKLKAKLDLSPKKSTPKVVAKSQKRSTESTSSDTKPKKKIINEIDRLLQDEGVVNLLYDVEQPDKKRLVPITKSRAKVMDLQKVQRELKIRKKLVRNAVLRLRTTTTGVTKVSPRSTRTSTHPSDVQVDKKMTEQVTSPKTSNAASPTEFILPAKIRNAADASVIIRRHSSSSFSSASGSPRVSIDAPEKFTEIAKLDDGTVHSLRSAKRRHSQDDKSNAKKSKKRAVEKPDIDATANTSTIAAATTITSTATTTAVANVINSTANNAEEKVISSSPRFNKKLEIKKIDKVNKQQDTVHENITSSKVTTRSNGATTGKVTAKSKKAVKSKAAFIRTGHANTEDTSKEEDELSACLAEAATALSVVNSNSRNVTTTRKGKGKGKHFRIFGNIFYYKVKK